MRKEAEAGQEQWEGTKTFQMWAAGAASSWLRDRAEKQGWGACGQWEASPVVGFRCQGGVQKAAGSQYQADNRNPGSDGDAGGWEWGSRFGHSRGPEPGLQRRSLQSSLRGSGLAGRRNPEV